MLGSRATCSCGFEGNGKELCSGFSVFEPVGDRAKGQGLNSRLGLFNRGPVSHNAWQFNDFRYPAAVFFLFDFDFGLHENLVLILPYFRGYWCCKHMKIVDNACKQPVDQLA